MAMYGLAGALLARLPGLAHTQAITSMAGPALAATGSRRRINTHTGRLGNPWEEVLQVAKGNPEKLRDIVDTLTSHCIKAQSAPPLHQYNELLRICEMHSDISSFHKLCQMACAVRMHLDHTTWDRLISFYSYFPKPFPSAPPKTQASAGHSMAQHATTGLSMAQHATGGGSSGSSSAGSSSSSGSSSARPGAILEAPPSSSIPSISATGGASSVSSSSSGSSAYATRPGARLSYTPQTNVWHSTSGSMSGTLPNQQAEHLVGSSLGEQQPQPPQQQQQPASNASSSAAAGMTSVKTPDAAA